MGINCYYLGIDIGSTTIKLALTDGEHELFTCYERHYSRVRERTVELLQRIRQEIAYRRLDLEQLQRCLVQEKLLESDAAPKLQEIPAPERFDDAERLCFEQCFAGFGQSEAAQECERLDYYSARFEAFLHQAQQKAASGQGLPCRLGLAAGAVAALILL